MMINYRNKLKTALSLIQTPRRLILPAGQNGLLKFIPDELYLKMVFEAEMGYTLDLQHPITYNEKIQWIKIHDRKDVYTLYADKYKVRDYIANEIGEKYLIPLLGVYKKASDIVWEKLPNRFVLKCNHSSGSNIICLNKKELDTKSTSKQLDIWLHNNAFWGGREWCYKNIEPCIICEEFLGTEDGATPNDYKIMCFNGTPKLIQVHQDRYGNHTLDFMDMNWKKTRIVQGPPNSPEGTPKPDVFDEMIEIAKVLSRNTFYSRIDLYVVGNSVKFGEITMYPTSGLCPFDDPKTDIILGNWIKLPIDY